MNTYTENHQIRIDLILHDSSKTPLTVCAIALSLTKQDKNLMDCRLTFQVPPKLYNRIDTEALFNLTPDIRNSSADKFLPETLIFQGLNYVSVEFGSSTQNKDLPRVFAQGNAIAEQLEAEFGVVHLVWHEGSQDYCASGKITASELQKYGPTPVCARTWFGPHLVKLIGSERLSHSGTIIQNTSWGGIQLDLVEHPWESDVEMLSNRQREVMNGIKIYNLSFCPLPSAFLR